MRLRRVSRIVGWVGARLRRRRDRVLLTFVLLPILAGVAAGIFRNPLFRGNLGIVEPGKVFRRAQPYPQDWPDLMAELKPASVLNLRGGWLGEPWYAAEFRLGTEGVDVYDFPMSATRRPSRGELLTLLDLFERCRYPLLIHCKSGSDRTGLASGLYLMAQLSKPPEEARAALALYYGHVGMQGTERMHDPFVEYAAWLKSTKQAHTPDLLRRWVTRVYRDDSRSTRFEVLLPGPRPLSSEPALTQAD